MTTKIEFLLNEALSMSPSERAMIAHCLIASIEEPVEEGVDQAWIEVAQKRLLELENSTVTPVSWEKIKQKIRA